MYRQSTVRFEQGSTLKISGLSAGHELYAKDTSKYSKPYNPSVAVPFHFNETEYVNISLNGHQGMQQKVVGIDSGYKMMPFNSTISGHPEYIEFSCIYGRDETDTSDWIVGVDNTDCGEFGDLMEEKESILSVLQETSFDVEGRGHFNLHTVVLMVSVMAFILAAGWVLNSGSDERAKNKMYSMETAPLLKA